MSIIIKNKKLQHLYHIHDQLEAGIVLKGWEVKSLRLKKIDLSDSYIRCQEGEVWMYNVAINPLQSASTHLPISPRATRKLLLKKSEIKRLIGKLQKTSYTAAPLILQWKKNYIKVTIAILEGKKLFDKRATIKQKDILRSESRESKQAF